MFTHEYKSVLSYVVDNNVADKFLKRRVCIPLGGILFLVFLYVYVCKPVWPSGKAGKQRDLGSNPLRLLLCLQKLWSVDTVL